MTLTPPIRPSTPRLVEILAFPAVQVLDVTGPLQVFASANVLASNGGHDFPYVHRVVAVRSPVMCSAGLGLTTDPLPPVHVPLDTLIVAAAKA